MAAFCGTMLSGTANVAAAEDSSTTVFRKPNIAAAASSSADAPVKKPTGDAPLEWRVRAPKSEPTAASAKSAPALAESKSAAAKRTPAGERTIGVRPVQFQSDIEPSPTEGPVLRAANDSVLLPTPSAIHAQPPTEAPTEASSATPRRLTPANNRSLRTAQRDAGEGLVPRQPRAAQPLDETPAAPRRNYTDDLPGETVTQPDPAEGIFGDQPTTSDPPATTPPATDVPTDVPSTDQPAPPAELPPATDTPPADAAPPAVIPPQPFPMPNDTPLPTTPDATFPANEREQEMANVLFGPVGPDGQRLGGELGDCLKTNLEVRRSRVVGIDVDISPPVHDASSTWSYDRPWRDVTGKTLFTGRPVSLDAISGVATFKTVDGQTRQVKLRDLSRVEQGYFLAMYPLPVECHLIDQPYRGRNWIESTYTWKASGACHKPLYFEDVHLERYGHSVGPILQPFASSAHFFGTLPILPYKMGLHPPTECIYTLGYYRPGNCAPYMLDPLPISVRGALFEAGAWVGGVVVIP